MKIQGKEYKLPKKFKDKWVKALRSGKYKQGVTLLHDKIDNKYCCLGVACRIQHPKMDLKSKCLIDDVEFKRLYEIDVPKELKGGLSPHNKNYNPLVKKLTNMNDSGKHSFKSIAAYIERYL